MPTDTVYGIQCLAFNEGLVDQIKKIKHRPTSMPFITLIADIKDLKLFDITITKKEQNIAKEYWPGPNTLIFKEKAFRLPSNAFLISILKKTGPLISTSANIHSHETVNTVEKAVSIFNGSINYYVDGGMLNNKPSNIYKIKENTIEKIR